MTTCNHWFGVGAPVGLGDSSAAVPAAQDLVNALATNGCPQTAFAECSAFQVAYNALGGPQITVDGKYGGNTQAALQQVMAQNLVIVNSGVSSTTAPTNCFGMAVPAVPGLDQAPSGGSGKLTVPTTTVTGKASTDYTPWLIGGAVVVGASGLAYVWYKKKHKRR
jgi:hypothetical protein